MGTVAVPGGSPGESAVEAKKKALDDKLSSLSVLQKEIVALKTDIQLLETGSDDAWKSDAEYTATKMKADPELQALKEFDKKQRLGQKDLPASK